MHLGEMGCGFYVLCICMNNGGMVKLKQCSFKTIKVNQQEITMFLGGAGPSGVVGQFGGGILHDLQGHLAISI